MFFCALDGAELTLCSSPRTYNNLIDGQHQFEVAARNPLGDSDETPELYEWEVAVPPDTEIFAKPDLVTTANTAMFTFGANELDSDFECALDPPAAPAPIPWEACDTPIEPPYGPLGEGLHTFKVRAIDNMGNIDGTPAEYTWRVNFPPNTTITQKPIANDPDPNATFEFSSSDPGSTFECQLDNLGWTADCGSPKTYPDLAVGGHTFKVRATDGYGVTDQTPANYAWTVLDTTPPNTNVDQVLNGSVIIHFSGSDNFSPDAALTYQCRLDNSSWASCTSPTTYTDEELSSGPHTFEVRAVDEAGNVDQSPATHNWTTADTRAPNTAISESPSNPTLSTTATFRFSGSDDYSATGALTYECRLDSTAPADWVVGCTSPKTYFGLTAGSHTFEVRATDAAGNTDATPASYTWTVNPGDTTPPDTVITQQPPLTTTETTATFRFNSTEAGSTFAVQARHGQLRGRAPTPKTYTGLTVGQHTVLR